MNNKNKLKEKVNKVRELEASVKSHIDSMYEKPSHVVRKKAIIELMKQYVPDKDFIDIGCAEGIYCGEALKYKAKSITGLDISATKISRARELFPSITFEVIDGDNISKYFNEKFNFILYAEVLQHVVDYTNALGEIMRILKNEGYLLLTVPNLSKLDHHIFASISDDMTVEELLQEIGGAGYGKQNAIWKFNANLLENEIVTQYPIRLIKKIPIDTPDGEIRNLWTVFLFRKLNS